MTDHPLIENARLKDVRPGDHVTWEHAETFHGVTRTVRREGIAHYPDQLGDWRTGDDGLITDGEDDATLTIRRPAPDLPPERDGVVLVPADGHKTITTADGKTFSRLTFSAKWSVWYGPGPTARPGDYAIQVTTASRLNHGTWKVEEK